MSKIFMSVKGEVPVGEMGVTLPHEHLLIDLKNFLNPLAKEASSRHLANQKITLENRGEVLYKANFFKDNLFQDDIDVAIEESKKFKSAGGKTIIDVTLAQIGRAPDALYKISDETGLNIIMGCGKYILSAWSEDDKKKSEKDLINEIIYEFENGVGDMAIKPGLIGEIGISDMKNPNEIKNLRASAIAQKELNCALIIHFPIWDKFQHEALDILEDAGADLSRTVVSHMNGSHDDMDFQESIAKRGVYIGYDSFGLEYKSLSADKFLPSDGQRITALMDLVKRGYIKQILVSHDISTKITFTKWGGWGLSHILNHIVPRLKQEGITEEQIGTLITNNPRDLICG